MLTAILELRERLHLEGSFLSRPELGYAAIPPPRSSTSGIFHAWLWRRMAQCIGNTSTTAPQGLFVSVSLRFPPSPELPTAWAFVSGQLVCRFADSLVACHCSYLLTPLRFRQSRRRGFLWGLSRA